MLDLKEVYSQRGTGDWSRARDQNLLDFKWGYISTQNVKDNPKGKKSNYVFNCFS